MYTKQIVPRFDRRTTRNLKANIIFELQYPLLQVGLKKNAIFVQRLLGRRTNTVLNVMILYLVALLR